MIIRDTTSRAFEFACHAASCAPPPAGTGGSKGGSGGRSGAPVKPNPIGPGGRRNPAQGMINKTIKDAEHKGGTAGKTVTKKAPGTTKEVSGYELKRGDRIHFAQSVKTVSSVGKQRNGRIGVSFTSGGVTDVGAGQKFKVAPPAKTVKVKSKAIPKGNPGKYTQRDKKYAMNPNNRANSQMHPDSKPETGKIVRPPKAKTTPPKVKRRGGPYDPGEQDQSNEVWA